MDADRFKGIKTIFQEAMELPVEERSGFLDEACKNDPEMRREVEALLESLDESSEFIETPAFESMEAFSAEPRVTLPGEQIGPFRIVRLIGSGGMGSVYEAVQDHPERTVALKTLQAGVASASALKRFELEKRILAGLRHPGIAQIFEAGTHGEGRAAVPYFAMEFIPHAKSIIDYAEAESLGARARLELFVSVCDAVHHGHQRGIIHRDLKPANILVDASSGEGRPKVIDFGVARATDSDIALTTVRTGLGQIIGTLQYMSPEQCVGDPGEVDIRSDVYSLGVVLYELLCGALPYDLSKRPITDAVQIISQRPARKLSSLKPYLRGDIETIVLKALAKDRERRYQSAADMARDIRRYLENRPIDARPAGMLYQFGLFARRNRVVVGAAAAILVALVVAVLVSARYAIQARNQAREAERRAVESEKTCAFLQQLLAAADPKQAKGREVTVREVLDQAAARIDGELNDQPEIEASVRTTIGKTYSSLGFFDEAKIHLDEALDLYEKVRGKDDRDTLNAMINVAYLLMVVERFDEAEQVYLEALARCRDQRDEHTWGTMASLRGLGQIYRALGRYSESEERLKEALEVCRTEVGRHNPNNFHLMNDLARLYSYQTRYGEAEAMARSALEDGIRWLGDDHPTTESFRHTLGIIYKKTGRFEEAEALLTQCLERRFRIKGEDHPDTFATMGLLGAVLIDLERYDEAERFLLDALEGHRRLDVENFLNVYVLMVDLSSVYRRTGRYDEARPLLVEALAGYRRHAGANHPHTLRVMMLLAQLHVNDYNSEAAEPLFREALQGCCLLFGEDSTKAFEMRVSLALCVFNQGRYDEAEELAREAAQSACAGQEDVAWFKSELDGLFEKLKKLDEE